MTYLIGALLICVEANKVMALLWWEKRESTAEKTYLTAKADTPLVR